METKTYTNNPPKSSEYIITSFVASGYLVSRGSPFSQKTSLKKRLCAK